MSDLCLMQAMNYLQWITLLCTFRKWRATAVLELFDCLSLVFALMVKLWNLHTDQGEWSIALIVCLFYFNKLKLFY